MLILRLLHRIHMRKQGHPVVHATKSGRVTRLSTRAAASPSTICLRTALNKGRAPLHLETLAMNCLSRTLRGLAVDQKAATAGMTRSRRLEDSSRRHRRCSQQHGASQTRDDAGLMDWISACCRCTSSQRLQRDARSASSVKLGRDHR
jgi:hypothetical protein